MSVQIFTVVLNRNTAKLSVYLSDKSVEDRAAVKKKKKKHKSANTQNHKEILGNHSESPELKPTKQHDNSEICAGSKVRQKENRNCAARITKCGLRKYLKA